MRVIAVAALVVAFGLAPAVARADDASRLALAKQLVQQVHLSDTMRALLPVMAAQMRTTLAHQGHDDADVRDYVAAFETRAAAEVGRYTDDMAAAYAGVFSEDEIKALLAFDETPIGRKLIAETPALARASMRAGHKLGIEVGKEVLDEMQARKDAQAKAAQKL